MFQETVVKEICGYKLVAVSGSRLLASATDALLVATAERMGCDIEIYGGTHKLSVEKKGKVLYVNPGSLTGAFSPTNVENNPSFILLALQSNEITVFTYQLKDGKLDVGKTSFAKGE
ncbi:hypothetical protein JH06_4473 [Blastocystis sp. subtype 4]|uniref:hypothetical protein n=1 Tax=Blastocystis sp. subtype 4 TaxID=944170 RepID=UPI000711655F|nr:hypothetical protein JH06_4473 [Blastocystis sp. subtype 4]KNB41971.1 hypothetical protein JH06_4473 [Blastocystis sp. subtype 4]|eukprot:XP_014525414.1 hypothetical protein JH06_4473 [Blastocystis sp. subtype 4]